MNFAISFQDPAGSQKTLETICQIQSRDLTEVRYEDENEEDVLELPSPTIENLQSVRENLETPIMKDKIAKSVLFSDFLDKLQGVYKLADSDQNTKKLNDLFYCYKALGIDYVVQLNSQEILDSLLSDEYYLDFFSALENDPSIEGKSFKLREVIETQIKYQNVLGILDQKFLAKIHHSYRLQFLKDTALSRCLDEVSAQTLLCFQLFSWRDLVSDFLSSDDIRRLLFDKISLNDPGSISFFIELSNIVKTCNLQMKIEFYEEIHKDGIMLMLYDLQQKANDDSKEKLLELIGEIYSCMLEIAPNIVKKYLISDEQKEKGFEMLKGICAGFLESKNIGVQQEISKLIKNLLEPSEEDKEFLDICEIFYNELLNKFAGKMNEPELNHEEIRICICEILGIFTYCIEKHQERIRTYLTMNEILKKALDLLKLKDKPISIAVLKLFREVVKRNDPYLTKYIISHNYFQLIFDELITNGEKENMLFSSILSIFTQVSASKNKLIIEHIYDKFVPVLKDTNLLGYLDQIVYIYKQQKEAENE